MAKTFDPRLSHSFHGVIWNTLADESKSRLFLEVRDVQRKQVTFSALNVQNNQWLWKDVGFDEPWWISLGAISGDTLLLNIYTATDNPDKKSLVAFDVSRQEILWWRNGFSLAAADDRLVSGTDAMFPGKEAVLDLFTGQPVNRVDLHLEVSQNFPVIRPFQYAEGSAHFDTVSNFLTSRMGIEPVVVMDYLEYEALIIVSFFLREPELANYLYVLETNGEVLLREKLGEGLKGVGIDTFFVFSGHLLFVKNKNELKSFKIL